MTLPLFYTNAIRTLPDFYNATLIVSAFDYSVRFVAVSVDNPAGSSVFFGIVSVVRVDKKKRS